MSLAKGTRDFTAQEIYRRKYIINILQNNFELFGFEPLETPSFENLSTLTGKYGEEGDRLIFKILESGDYMKGLKEEWLAVEKLNKDIKDFIQLIIDSSFKEKIDILKLENFEYQQDISYYPNPYFLDILKNNHFQHDIDKYYDYLVKNKNDRNSVFENFISNKIKTVYYTELINGINSKEITKEISDKALRYDLTVPFARFVAMNHGKMSFPFKRYQIQPVWRADRPQKGRFREFYQCDADVVGSYSLWQEVELVQLYLKSFQELGIPVSVCINNRKILSGLAEYADISEQLIDFTVALDKLDKIGKEGVIAEMREKGISETAISQLDFLFNNLPVNEVLALLKEKFQGIEVGEKGIEELEFVLDNCQKLGVSLEDLVFDITLARGLDYYTGAIFEVKAKNVQMGSIGGGGRYDNLTEVFGVKDKPGIGISFGLDRIYLVMEELNLFPKNTDKKVEYLFANYGENEALEAMKIISQLRQKGVSAELYPENAKLKKQFTYAEKKEIPTLVFYGEEEIKTEQITLKNLESGEQRTIGLREFLDNI